MISAAPRHRDEERRRGRPSHQQNQAAQRKKKTALTGNRYFHRGKQGAGSSDSSASILTQSDRDAVIFPLISNKLREKHNKMCGGLIMKTLGPE